MKTNLYSCENLIRKIDSVKLVTKPAEYLCGQSVIAMLADVSVDEVQNDRGTTAAEIKFALEWYGLVTESKSRVTYADGASLPECTVLSIKMPGYGHWLLYFRGKFYDPEFGVSDDLPERAKRCYYWEIAK